MNRTFCPASGARFKSKELFFLSLLSRHVKNVLIAPVAVADAVFKSDLVRHPAVLGVVNLIDCAAVLLLARLIGRPALPEV